MLSLTTIESVVLFPRPTVMLEGGDSIPGLGRQWDQPDIKKNPRFWLKLYLEGVTLHRRSFALANRGQRILDLGCGSGWFGVYLAQSRTDISIDSVDKDGRLLDWGRIYCDRLRHQAKGEFGQINFRELDIEEFPWHEHVEEFDVVHAGFILSRCKDPLKVLDGIYSCLKPGGWLIYHDCTEPPAENLDRLAQIKHRLKRLHDRSSDPWSWRRSYEMKYNFDTIRAQARKADPKEGEVLRRMEELFAMRYHVRGRALLDLALKRPPKRSVYREALYVPLAKLVDDILCQVGGMVGGVRYVLGQKR